MSSSSVPKKLYLLRHTSDTHRVYDHSRYVTPINALTPSKLVPSKQVRQTYIAIPEALVKHFERFEPFLFPILFPVGLASATLQSLPMVLSVLPLAFLFGLAAVVVVPVICLGGITASSYVLARAAVKLLTKQTGVNLGTANFLLLAQKWHTSLLQSGTKLGGRAIMSTVELLMSSTLALGALASLQSQPVPATVPEEEEVQGPNSSETPTDSSAQNDKQSLDGSRPPLSSSPHVNFAATAAAEGGDASSPSSTPARAYARAQSIFQSLLLAPNNQTLAYQSADQVGAEYRVPKEPVDSRTAVPMRSALSRAHRRSPAPSSPAGPSRSPSSASISPPSYFAANHYGHDLHEGLVHTPGSASTPGYTPLTPMTPITPHMHAHPLPSSHGLVPPVRKSVSFALPEEPSESGIMSSLHAALSRLTAERSEDEF